MIVDAQQILAGSLSAAGAITGQLVTATGNTVGTNTIDLAPLTIGGNQAGDTGAGEPIEVEISILQSLTSAGSATVQFQLIQADDAALTSNVQVVVQTDAFGYASLTAGTVIPLHWDRAAPYAPKRYFGLRIVIGTAALTNGTAQFFAAIVKNVQDVKNLYFKSGYSVT